MQNLGTVICCSSSYLALQNFMEHVQQCNGHSVKRTAGVVFTNIKEEILGHERVVFA